MNKVHFLNKDIYVIECKSVGDLEEKRHRDFKDTSLEHGP